MESKRNQLEEMFADEKLEFVNGFDNAIIGVDSTTFNSPTRVVYSIQKCLEILMEENNWNAEMAYEYFSYNISGAYTGKKTPIWLSDEIFY